MLYSVYMDKEMAEEFSNLREQFTKLEQSIEQQISKLVEATAAGFANVESRMATKDDVTELQTAIRAVSQRVDQLPNDVDETYAEPINDLLERVTRTEKRLDLAGIPA